MSITDPVRDPLNKSLLNESLENNKGVRMQLKHEFMQSPLDTQLTIRLSRANGVVKDKVLLQNWFSTHWWNNPVVSERLLIATTTHV